MAAVLRAFTTADELAELRGLARRHRVPVRRDDALARMLVGVVGPVPDAHWPRRAEIVAAVKAR